MPNYFYTVEAKPLKKVSPVEDEEEEQDEDFRDAREEFKSNSRLSGTILNICNGKYYII